MNAPTPRQLANRLNRLRGNIAPQQAAPPPQAGFWAKFMFYAKGGYDTPNGPIMPNRPIQTPSIDSATVAAPYITAVTPGKSVGSKVTPKSVAGFLFMPQIGQSLKSLTFAWTLLIQIMAGILVSNRLLSAEHPAITYRGAQQTRLIDLFRTARDNFRFSLKDMPKAVVWLSLVAFIFVIGGLLVTAVAKVGFGVSHAFAATPASPGTNPVKNIDFKDDVASKLIDSFFGLGSYASGGVPAINTLISTFNNMILILGGIILVMTIISVVAETARTGVPFGKNFNPVWAPIRLILAIAFMVPLANGLSSGQNILINLVKWSSNFTTTQLWQPFSQKVLSGENSISAAIGDQQSEGQAIFNEYIRATMIEYNNAKFCERVINNCAANEPPAGATLSANGEVAPGTFYIHDQLYVMPVTENTYNVTTDNANNPQQISGKTIKLVNPATYRRGDPIDMGSLVNGESLFGSIVINAYDPNVYAYLKSFQGQPAPNKPTGSNFPSMVTNDTIGKALALNYDTFMQSRNTMLDASNNIASQTSYFLMQPDGIQLEDLDDMFDIAQKLKGIQDNYEISRRGNIQQAIGLLKNSIDNKTKADGALAKQLNAFGWVGAPTFVGTLGKLNADFQDALRSVPYITFSKENPTLGSDANYLARLIGSTYPSLYPYAQDYWDKGLGDTGGKGALADAVQQAGKSSTNNNNIDTLRMIFASTIFDVSNPSCINAGACEIHDNPIVHMTAVGRFITQALVAAMYGKNDIKHDDPSYKNSLYGQLEASCKKNEAIGNSAECAKIAEKLKTSKAEAIGAGINVSPFMIPFLTFGFMLGFFLPLLPLFRFLLGVLGWLMLVFEAVLAIPLLGIAHLRTDGEGIMGSMAQGGYLMILGLLIKPALMVIGLISGLVLFTAIIQITGYIFQPLIFQETDAIAFGMNMLLFASFITVIANSTFKMIDIIPNSVISWIGGRMDSKVDDASSIQSNSLGTIQSLGQSVSFGQNSQLSQQKGANAGGGNEAMGQPSGGSNIGGLPSNVTTNAMGGLDVQPKIAGTGSGTGGSHPTVPLAGSTTPQTSAFNSGSLNASNPYGAVPMKNSLGGINGTGNLNPKA